MNQLSPDLREDLLEVLDEVATLMSAEYAQLGPLPDDHPLAQSGLENGAEIVLDFIAHGEAGVALDHLLYMIKSLLSLSLPDLPRSWLGFRLNKLDVMGKTLLKLSAHASIKPTAHQTDHSSCIFRCSPPVYCA